MNNFVKNTLGMVGEKLVTGILSGMVLGASVSVVDSMMQGKYQEKHLNMRDVLRSMSLDCESISDEILFHYFSVAKSLPCFSQEGKDLLPPLATALDSACSVYKEIEAGCNEVQDQIVAREMYEKIKDILGEMYLLLPANKACKESVKEDIQMLFSLSEQLYMDTRAMARYNQIKAE
jgi:hypothetical protein